MTKHISIILLLLMIVSCDSKQENRIDISKIDINFSIDRFDVDFYTATESSLDHTKEKYPFFFSNNQHDSIWVNKINNKDERELFIETQKQYNDISFLKADLKSLFKHVKYYNSKFMSPKVVTLLSNIDHQNRVIYTAEYLLISLDSYLGEDHRFYADYPKYMKINNHKSHIIVDVAKKVVDSQIPPSKNRDFISKMVREGKKMYLLDRYLPQVLDQEKIGYEKDKFIWAENNEEQVWKYFIENKLLFSSETKLNKRFLENGPFSKFYRAEDNSSPGRIGVWIGWQIVRSYMEHNDVPLQKMMRTGSEEIFKKSKYKPKK
jgi:gliding motility-associated lipoprotein GldB